MKIAVFGSSGNVGKFLVEQALAEQYDVIAYARNPSKLTIKHDRLTIMQGELSNEAMIERTITGVDAVISVMGPSGKSRGTPITQGMKYMIAAMNKHGVRRLIALSIASSKDPNDKPGTKIKTMITFVKTTSPDSYADIVSWSEVIRASNLDWTLVRVLLLNDKPKTGNIKTRYPGRNELGTQIFRADLADFMLKQVKDTKYIRQAPIITN
ncbi:MAG: NAD(P)-dependent oxidoreductase [Halobacteriota archaeon]